MKALSLKPEWALTVMLGLKTIEHRTWKTDYRGDLLICSSASKFPGTISGHALCIVELTDIEPFTKDHLDQSGMDHVIEGFAWHIELKDWVVPFQVKGKLHLYDVNEPIEIIPETVSNRKAIERYFKPLVYWGKDEKASRKFFDYCINTAECLCW